MRHYITFIFNIHFLEKKDIMWLALRLGSHVRRQLLDHRIGSNLHQNMRKDSREAFFLLNVYCYNVYFVHWEIFTRKCTVSSHTFGACNRTESLLLKLIHGCGNRDPRMARPFVTASSTVIHGEPFIVHCTVFHGLWNRDDNF